MTKRVLMLGDPDCQLNYYSLSYARAKMFDFSLEGTSPYLMAQEVPPPANRVIREPDNDPDPQPTFRPVLQRTDRAWRRRTKS
jgi:hypothetical protein